MRKTTINRWTFTGLVNEAESRGLSIQWRVMPGYSGAVDLTTGTVFLDQQLDSRPRYALSVLAHELGHVAHGHGCAQGPAGEALADQWAARLLISPAEYRLAERLHGCNRFELARELGVTCRLVDAYQNQLTA